MNPGQRVRVKHDGPSTDRQIFTFVGVTAHDAQTATLLREDGKTISVDVASIELVESRITHFEASGSKSKLQAVNTETASTVLSACPSSCSC